MEMRKTSRQIESDRTSSQFATCILSIFIFVFIFIFGQQLVAFSPSEHLALANDLTQAPALSALQTVPSDSQPRPLSLSPQPDDAERSASLLTLRGTVQKGESAVTIFRQAGIKAAQVMALQKAVHNVYNLNRLDVGHPYIIRFSPDGQLRAFTYDIDLQHQLEVVRRQETFVGRLRTRPHKRSERVVAGRITDTIYAALVAKGESIQLITDFAEIFAWSVDFSTALRPGDTYRLLIEEHQYEGQEPQYHRIMAAELVNRSRLIQTVYFQTDQIEGYYQPDGRSMRSLFLRSPLRYTRISSRFSHDRFHPILKRRRPHLGVDLAAPLGTPVRTIGDGKVMWAGVKGASGKMVKIKHNQTYSSYYMHLAKYAKGIRAGARVKQGQVIGYVGSTGLSTGPHLDFRLTQNGQYVNPLAQRNLSVPPLSKTILPQFKLYAKNLIKKLDQVKLAMQQAPPTQVVE